MIDLELMQKKVYQNKIDKGFNVTDIHLEFCFLQTELSEAFEAYHKKEATVGEELADVALYLLGLSEILGINLEKEIVEKHEKNLQRKYIHKDGITIRVSE